MKTVSFAATVLLLTACAAAPSAVSSDPGHYPENYRALVKEWMRNTLFDPYSVRDLEITAPTKGTLWRGLVFGGALPAWIVCATFNAKNRFGGYVGRSTSVLFIRDNAVITTEDSGSNTMSSYRCGAVSAPSAGKRI